MDYFLLPRVKCFWLWFLRFCHTLCTFCERRVLANNIYQVKTYLHLGEDHIVLTNRRLAGWSNVPFDLSTLSCMYTYRERSVLYFVIMAYFSRYTSWWDEDIYIGPSHTTTPASPDEKVCSDYRHAGPSASLGLS